MLLAMGSFIVVQRTRVSCRQVIRVMLVDFWEKGPKYQKPMLWTIAVIWVAVMLPGAFFMLKRTVGIMFGGN